MVQLSPHRSGRRGGRHGSRLAGGSPPCPWLLHPRQLSPWLLSLGLVGSLAACGGSPRSGSRAASAPAGSATPASAQTPPKAPDAKRSPAPAAAAGSATPADAQKGAAAAPPPPPQLVANTGAIASRAVDDTVGRPIGQALVGLAQRYMGLPYRAFSLDKGPKEVLRLDLTGFDCQLFVEQLLALVNSRAVRTQTAAVQRFGEHVRRLRYDDGRVDYCHRHHYFSRWAEAAERQGYLVNITPYLPGAVNRTIRLNWMSRHPGSYGPMRQAANKACITALEQGLSVRQSYIPVGQLAGALPSLRDGDIFALVTRLKGLDVTHMGLLAVEGQRVAAIHAAPGRGVMRSDDLARYSAKVPDVIGVTVLRPMPNPDGKPGG